MEQLHWTSSQIEEFHSFTTSTIVLKKCSQFCLQKIQFLSSDVDPQIDSYTIKKLLEAQKLYEKMENAKLELGKHVNQVDRGGDVNDITQRGPSHEIPSEKAKTEKNYNDSKIIDRSQGNISLERNTYTSNKSELLKDGTNDSENTIPSNENGDNDVPKGYLTILDNKFIISKSRLKETLLFLKKESYSIQDFFNYHIHLNLKDYNPEIMDSYSKNTHFIGKMNPVHGDIEEVLIRNNDIFQELIICFKWKTDAEMLEGRKSLDNEQKTKLTHPPVVDENITNPSDIDILIPNEMELLEESIKEDSKTESTKSSEIVADSTSSVPCGQSYPNLSEYYSLLLFIEKDIAAMSHPELRAALALYKEALGAKDAIIEREEAQIERLTNEVVNLSFDLSALQNRIDTLEVEKLEREKSYFTALDAKELELERLRAEYDVIKEGACCGVCSIL